MVNVDIKQIILAASWMTSVVGNIYVIAGLYIGLLPYILMGTIVSLLGDCGLFYYMMKNNGD